VKPLLVKPNSTRAM